MVFVALHRPLHPVHQRSLPPRIIAGVLCPAGAVEAVSFKIAFKNHVESQPVRQRKELGVRRVMRGPDGIDVVLLHQPQLGLHHIPRHRAAKPGMVLVAVYAAKQDPPAVHFELGVLDRDAPEAQLQRDSLAGGADSGVVEAWDFGGPRLHAGDLLLHPGGQFEAKFRNADDGVNRLPRAGHLNAE